MTDYWARWCDKLQQITKPYEPLEMDMAPPILPGEGLLEYYRCLERLMRPLDLLQENRESPGEELIERYEALKEQLEGLSAAHPWFSEDESTQELIRLLEVFTARRSADREKFEEKIGALRRRIEELEDKLGSGSRRAA
ncbi:hypothetical protein [Methanothrix harundinacea]|jgi:predicted nuclease with TOPRIM domain|uniref:Uncharacterized protein n=1 Tax=Methanothrix harundinacea (strain 6Ac) TaxID=1110509 RepID=G7WQD8_METH6|nr:hypothetical protein [Methanothrix harundinacea]AET65491.1 hypothetical protein Mhar_2138 [Methanothrix harundinacea 6Ac]